MRSNPITRDEIRLHHSRGVTTMPANSLRKPRVGISPEPIPKLWRPLLRALNQDRKPGEHELTMPLPELSWGRQTCRHCRGEFYRAHNIGGVVAYCSDRCATIVHQAAVSKSRSEQRALERAGRTCKTCGKPITAQRSTMRFCSVKCRVAAHRGT
jgi:hypothetical protein